MKPAGLVYTIALILLVIGGLNWGLVGAFDLDLVAKLFGIATMASRIIYIIVGLSAIYVAIAHLAGRGKS